MEWLDCAFNKHFLSLDTVKMARQADLVGPRRLSGAFQRSRTNPRNWSAYAPKCHAEQQPQLVPPFVALQFAFLTVHRCCYLGSVGGSGIVLVVAGAVAGLGLGCPSVRLAVAD